MWCIGPVVSESLCVYDVCGESTELCGKYVGLVASDARLGTRWLSRVWIRGSGIELNRAGFCGRSPTEVQLIVDEAPAATHHNLRGH